MTKVWKLFYKKVMTHITYASWYKPKTGFMRGGGGWQAEKYQRVHRPLSSHYPKHFSQAYMNPETHSQHFHIPL